MAMMTGKNKAAHIQIWSGSRSARVTDITHAGKRGKRCNVLRFQGCPIYESEEYRAGRDLTNEVLSQLEAFQTAPAPWEKIADRVEKMVAEALSRSGIHPGDVTLAREEIRGVDAPREVLTFRNDNFYAQADEDGIHLSDLTDRNNDPREITINQSKARAYDIARTCWAWVCKCETMSQASDVLRQAGARLHGYCAMD